VARILIISQVFYPDMTAVSQALMDLAEDLSKRGHEVIVFSSRLGYEDSSTSFSSRGSYRGASIIRLRQTAFSKKSKLGRIINFASFNFNMMWRLSIAAKGRYELIVGTTVPRNSSEQNTVFMPWICSRNLPLFLAICARTD
jgi:hypothetical protein